MKCEHHETCGRETLEGTGENLCILHSQIPTKDEKAFNEALAEHRLGKKDCDFSRFVFPGDADFKDTVFNEWASFFYTTFTRRADFLHSKFTKGADFSGAKFIGDADFFDTSFNGGAKFIESEFTCWARFSLAIFKDWTLFTSTIFSESVSFTSAEFMVSPDFFDAKFLADANFSHATFNKGADFSGVTFGKAVQFFRVKFLGSTFFLSRQAKERNIPIFSGSVIGFNEVTIDPLDVLTFRDADLQKCLFVGTDVRKAEFAGVKWPKIGDRYGVYDEIEGEEKSKTHNHPHIEQLYRQLKQNYEDRKDYERASDFHYGEKEMRRRNPDTSWGLWFWLTLYWLVSGYGERWVRPLIWAAGLLVVSTLAYLWLGLHPKGGGGALTWTSFWDWLRTAFYSFQVITLLRPDDLAPVGYAKIVHVVESLVGPLLIGLFALALRQKLKR